MSDDAIGSLHCEPARPRADARPRVRRNAHAGCRAATRRPRGDVLMTSPLLFAEGR